MVEMQAMLWTYTSGLRGRAQNWPVAGRSACRGEVGLPRAGLVLLFRECGGECGNPNPIAEAQVTKSHFVILGTALLLCRSCRHGGERAAKTKEKQHTTLGLTSFNF